tara:strand:+ start:855 stop:1022 length:168 start_codon:yes stop_codon:yes gene_type:complete
VAILEVAPGTCTKCGFIARDLLGIPIGSYLSKDSSTFGGTTECYFCRAGWPVSLN